MKRWHMEEGLINSKWLKHRKQHVESNIGRSTGYRTGQVVPGSDPNVVDCTCDLQEPQIS